MENLCEHFEARTTSVYEIISISWISYQAIKDYLDDSFLRPNADKGAIALLYTRLSVCIAKTDVHTYRQTRLDMSVRVYMYVSEYVCLYV